MEKQKQKGILPLVLATALLLAFPLLSATTTLVSPAANGNYTGTMLVNCTTDLANTMNASIIYNTGGANTTLTTIANTSTGQTVFNSSAVSISGLTDGLSYNFFCRVTNETSSQENSTVNTGITIDNTAPTCSFTYPYSTVASPGTEPLSWTSADALSLNNTNVTVTGPTGFTTLSYTTASATDTNVGSLTLTGTYTATITAYDRPGNTCTKTVTWTVYNPGYSSSGSSGSSSSGSPGFSIGGGNSTHPSTTTIIIVAVVIVGLVFLFKKKK